MAATAVRAVLGAAPETQGAVAVAALEKVLDLHLRDRQARQNLLKGSNDMMRPITEAGFKDFTDVSNHVFALQELLRKLLMREAPLSTAQLSHMLNLCGQFEEIDNQREQFIDKLVERVEHAFREDRSCAEFSLAIRNLVAKDSFCGNPKAQALKERLRLLTAAVPKLPVMAGEAWSDAVITALDGVPAELVKSWSALLVHCRESSASTPSARWKASANEFLKSVGESAFRRGVTSWLLLVDKPRTQPIDDWNREWQPDPNQLIIEPHADILKGLAWCCGLREDKELAHALTALALSSYRKVPKIGPRLVKVGNACVTALGMMPGMEGVYQLALLKVKVKFGTAQKVIEKALNVAAERVKIPRADLEEMAVPAYGLTNVGVCEEPMGEFTARLTVTGGGTEIAWVRADGKVQKGIPAAVKKEFAEELKELKSAAKDIERMLPAQKERIDNLFLRQKSWPFETWRERYLDHPLVGVITRRLLWVFTKGGKAVTGIWFDGRLVDVDLQPVVTSAETTVELWHPIGRDLAEIMGWRAWLDAQQIQQPFKQAHREVYLLTDAERNTRSYSNRFAGHVLKQHQFNALCAARSWKNKLRLMVDDEYPPASKLLPQWGLRAEYWIEGAGDEYGRDTNETGTFLYLTTDQVRFYPVEAVQRTAHASGGGYHPGYQQNDSEPMPLEQIPPLVLSEILRDVDLFVGVSSVGNDPNWADGGPTGRYADYWQSYSFGDLGATARTRKEVLEWLVPRLKITKQCSFDDKFLVVKGTVRTYKIHLGSGNILMKPNDQYLCIVPSQGKAEDGKLQLPFEGDRTLSIILSKAFLLAADDKIKDPTILSQMGLENR